MSICTFDVPRYWSPWRDRVGGAAQQLGGLADRLLTVEGARLAPRPETLLRRFERAIQIGAAGTRHRADRFAGRRVHHRQFVRIREVSRQDRARRA